MSTIGCEWAPKRTDDASNASHPIPVGETVTIFKLPSVGPPFVEGRAVVEAVANEPHCYRVRFRGDRAVRERTVHPEYQRDPERMLEMLLDIWRASNTPAFDEFFPEENT